MSKAIGQSSIIVEDPFEEFAQARDENPVYWDEVQEKWKVYRYADVEYILGSHRVFSSRNVYSPFKAGDNGTSRSLQSPLIGTMGDLDPPRHKLLRSLGQPSFTARQVERLTPRIYEITGKLFDSLRDKQEFEFVEEFARPLPLLILPTMLDVPEDELSQFTTLAAGFISGNPLVRLGLVSYLDKLVQRRRSSPGDDFISELLHAQSDEVVLTNLEIIGYCMALLYAGSHSSTHLLGSIIVSLSQFPDQQRLLIENPQLVQSAIDEVLRYRSAIMVAPRVASEQTILGDQTIQAGQRLSLFLLSANHDEAVFAEPEQFDIARQPNPHIAFGRGIHYCLGAPLARLELKVFLELLIERMPDLHVVSGAKLERIPPSIFFGYESLPVTQSRL